MIINDPASPDFNSYVSVEDFTAYAEDRGIAIPENPEPLLHEAMDYLESLAYAGEPTDRGQNLSFPRTGVWCNGFELDGGTIPKVLKTAQIRLALTAMDVTLSPSYSGGAQVQSESIQGAISVTYDTDGGNVTASPTFPWLNGLIGCLRAGASTAMTIPVWRA